MISARTLKKAACLLPLAAACAGCSTVHANHRMVVEESPARERVVLLHGLGRTGWSLNRLDRFLSRCGYEVIIVRYPSTRTSVEQAAEGALKEALAGLEDDSEVPVHFVTHSLGGILVRWYLEHYDLPTLGRVVMLCPPNQGSEISERFKDNFLFRTVVGPAGGQLGTSPDSLPNRLGPVDFELGVIAGDRTVNPIFSRFIPGRDDGKVSVDRTMIKGMKDMLVVHRTHTFIMQRREVHKQVAHFLEKGRFHHAPVPRAD